MISTASTASPSWPGAGSTASSTTADRAAPRSCEASPTLKRWRGQILAWHTTGASNGPTEGLNSIIKKVKRVGAGFRSFANYRLRILLAVGGCDWSLLGRAPR